MSDNSFLDTSDCDENESRMVLYVETLTGTIFEMMVSPLDTVLSIKNKIQHDEGIPVNQQALIVGERELTNTKTLEEEGITKGSSLRLVLAMRGGPISTRRASSRNEHLIWREIRDFVETTRDDMMSKVPPGAKITLLVYREGDAINFLKVVENKDGSYSSLSDFAKPIIPSASASHSRSTRHSSKSHNHSSSSRTPLTTLFPPILSDPEKLNETFREHKDLTNKMNELRHKMQEMSLRKKNRMMNKNAKTSPTSDVMQPLTLETSKTVIATPDAPIISSTPQAPHKNLLTQYKTDSMFNAESIIEPKSVVVDPLSGRKKVKQWLNSDYYDEEEDIVADKPSSMSTRSSGSIAMPVGHKKIKSSKHYFKSNTHYDDFYVNKTFENFRPHRHHRHTKASSSAEAGENIATSTATNFLNSSSVLSDDDEEDEIFNEFNFEIIDEDDNENDFHNKKYKLKTSSPNNTPATPITRYRSRPTRGYSFYISDKSAIDSAGSGGGDGDDDDDDLGDSLLDATKFGSDMDGLDSTLTTAAAMTRTIDNKKIGATSLAENSSPMIAEYFPDINSSNFIQTVGHHRKSQLDDSTIRSSGDDEDEDLNSSCSTHVHEASSIAIYEEEPESNVGNDDEPEFNASATGPISVPSPDADTFTISQIPRERVSTSTGKNSARNRIRVARFVLKDDDEPHRPKTSPDKISREFCEFLLHNSADPESKKVSEDRKYRYKRTKYLTNTSNSKLEKINNLKVALSNNSVCSWPPRGGTSTTTTAASGGEFRLAGSLLQPYYEQQNRVKVTKVDHLSGIRNKGFYESSATISSTSKSSEIEISRHSTNSTIEHLPDIELKKSSSTAGSSTESSTVNVRVSHRVRCKKCNKKLNISTIYECRCGDKFCSQHRYSEVHGCKFDYKTEGRRLIEQANPLILAPKLPKI